MMNHGAPTKALPPSAFASTVDRLLIVGPYMYQICVSSVTALCHRTSSTPSRSKSLAPTMRHGSPTNAGPLLFSQYTVARRVICSVFIYQICVSPLAALCQMISCLPSLFMSPVATMLHGKPTKMGAPFSANTVVRRAMLVPFISHSCVSPVDSLCHTMSGQPSPFMSAAPTTLQGGPMNIGLPYSFTTVERPTIRYPAMNQTWSSPVLLLYQRISV